MVIKEESKNKVLRLVNNFVENKTKFEKMKETDIRNKLIDPLFENLGWDIDGKEIPDEVIREETIRTGKTKFIDYTFKINGITKFVVEAKAVSEDLGNSQYVKQVIEYAYNKACLWAVLTDFEEVKIFLVDRDYKETPIYDINLSDTSRFDENFEKLWKFISKEGISSNNLENEAKDRGQLKDKVPIDQQLLDDLVIWRKGLTDDIRMRYKDRYDEDTIDEIVQRIIDRLIFIRKTEDAGIEDRILDQITRREDKYTYGEIKKLFERFNRDYNSKLFGEDTKDKHECDLIDISNNVIKKVIKGLYVPSKGKIEYNFAVIDADILGNIYEQYLSFILKKAGKGAKLVGGKAHRKEQGIYYTPTYIVDYIVRNTLGEMLKAGKSPEDIKILDPACGSGSFLLKAFDYLDNYFDKKYGKQKQATLDNIKDGLFDRRSKILKNNIFGVDLDPKAVEIAQLNLLLKMAEKRGRLPTLKENINCGNSLVSDDKFSDRAFRWEVEFKNIMKNGGFDIVIGNPPYGAELSEEEQNYLDKLYKIGSTDTAILFIKKSFELLKENGKLAFIVPKALCFASNYEDIRDFIWNNLETIVDCGKVWKEVKLEQVIFILSKGRKSEYYNSYRLRDSKIEYTDKINKRDSKQFGFFLNGVSSNDVELAKKIKSKSIMLNDISTNQRGAMLQKFVSDEGSLEVIGGAQIQRFGVIGIKGKIEPSHVDSEQAYVKNNSLLVQNIVAHIENPVDHIKIIACVPQKNYLILDTINQLSINKKYSSKLIWCFLNSKLINWYAYRFIFGKAIRTMHFDNSITSRLPIPKETNRKVLDEIISLVNKILSLSKHLNEINIKTDESQKLKESIDRIQNDINYKIYELYGLTQEEINIVENS